MKRITQVFMLGLLVALWGCGKEEGPKEEAPQAGAAAGAQGESAGQAEGETPAAGQAGEGAGTTAMKEAQNIYNMRCAICHGQNGNGDGPGAASLTPKPRDYSDKAWQESVTDEHLKKVIVEGGQSVGKSAIMPPNPDLGQKPEVLAAMVEIIRNFAK